MPQIGTQRPLFLKKVFETAVAEVLRPLKNFVQADHTDHTTTITITKPGLLMRGQPLENYYLQNSISHLNELCDWVNFILHDNLQNTALHAKPHWQSIKKYNAEDFKQDFTLLSDLYKDHFISAEKKELVVDLETSTGHYLKSSVNPKLQIFDAASQIASLNLGFNSVKRHALIMRPESQCESLYHETDLEIALANFLKRESGLPYLTFLNSGSEANDFCLSYFKKKYPQRSCIFAFEGSFHGRTLLALHATHSPTKREPFEIFKGLVEFFAFPETKTPQTTADEPKEWLNHWSSKHESLKNPDFLSWLKSGDAVLKSEIAILERIRKEFRSGTLPFAMIVEPMQCEGGDRYCTPRFMRALRVLTRLYQVPLVFDEVQTGFGLSGPFFWHEHFELKTSSGGKDFPDAITVAKKAQVAACLSGFDMGQAQPPSLAGLHRGYIQAQAAKEGPEVDNLEDLLIQCTEHLKSIFDSNVILNPRGKGFCLAFDLPSEQVTNDLIKARFENGILIYPAGTKTLRFRFMTTTRRRDLFEMFKALYNCFQHVSLNHEFNIIQDEESYLNKIKEILGLESFDLSHEYTESVSKDLYTLPNSSCDLSAISQNKWQKIFITLARNFPELVTTTTSTLETLNKSNDDFFINQYLNPNNHFTWVHLLWELARKHSFEICRWSASDIQNSRSKIDVLQAETYEPVRRASVDDLINQAKDPRTISLACVDAKGALAGMCIAIPLENATDLPFFLENPTSPVMPNDLYSTDLTVNAEHRSNGLGLRLKIEQLITSRLSGFRRITSRNRFPEAKAMSRLNQKMGAVVCDVRTTDYGGSGTGLYQSLEFRQPPQTLKIFQSRATLQNKMCLSNFVSESYIHFLKIWREVIPQNLRHIYVSSGESESVDKWIKTLYSKRPQAHYSLSFLGDHFGKGTACSKSLGCSLEESVFEWPKLDPKNPIKSLKKHFSESKPDQILGVFIDPMNKPWLSDVVSLCNEHSVPVVFNETQSMLGRYSPHQIFACEHLDISGFYFYGSNQIAINAMKSDYFISKPLAMISTWDGDEWSLQIATEKLLNFLKDFKHA